MPGEERQPLLPKPQHADSSLSDGASSQTAYSAPVEKSPPTFLQQTILVPCFTLLVLMVITNAVCVIPLQGSIASEYDAYDYVPWIIVVHSIAQSCALPLMGRLSRIFGTRQCLFASSLVFTGGMGIMILSQRFAGFLLGRALSGVGAGGCLTTSMVMIIEVVSESQRAFFLGILNAGYTLGFATGAALGGIFVHDWKLAFVTQMPLILLPGTLVFVIGKSLDGASSTKTVKEQLRRIDVLGVLTLSSASSVLLYTFNLPHADWRFYLASLALFLLFGCVEAGWAAEPIIPVSFLVQPQVIFSCIGILANVISWWCILFYFPVQVIAVWGELPSSTGAYLAPATAAFAVGGILVGKYWTQTGASYYWHTIASVTAFAGTLLVFYLLPNGPNSSQWPFILTESVAGWACAAVVSYSLSELLSSVQEGDRPIVASLFASFRGQAGSIGGALGSSTILKTVESKMIELLTLHDHGAITPEHFELARKVKGSPTLVWQLKGWERDLAISAWQAGMGIVWTIGIISGLVSLVLFSATRLSNIRTRNKGKV